MFRSWWFFAALSVGLVSGGPISADEKPRPDDPKSFIGTWVAKAQTIDAQDVPAEVAAKQGFTFQGDKVTARGGLLKAGDSFVATPSVDKYTVKFGTDGKLKTIALTETGEGGRTIPGIYKFEKGQLVLVLNYKNGDRPTKFESPADSGHCLFVLEKAPQPESTVKPAPEKPAPAPKPGVNPATVPSTASPVTGYGTIILVKLNVTEAEEEKWKAVNEEAGEKYWDMHAAYAKTGDIDQLMADRLVTMRWQRGEIEKILGEKRYAEYKRMSAEAYKPLFDNGKGAPDVAIVGRGGKPTTYKLRAATKPEDIDEFERLLEVKLKKLGKLPPTKGGPIPARP